MPLTSSPDLHATSSLPLPNRVTPLDAVQLPSSSPSPCTLFAREPCYNHASIAARIFKNAGPPPACGHRNQACRAPPPTPGPSRAAACHHSPPTIVAAPFGRDSTGATPFGRDSTGAAPFAPAAPPVSYPGMHPTVLAAPVHGQDPLPEPCRHPLVDHQLGHDIFA